MDGSGLLAFVLVLFLDPPNAGPIPGMLVERYCMFVCSKAGLISNYT